MSDPRLLICGFSAFPAVAQNPAAAVVEALERAKWSPEGFETAYLTLPVAWRGSVEAVAAYLADRSVEAILVVGVAVSAESFRVEFVAHNRACRSSPDHDGEFWPLSLVAEHAPAQIPATAPVGDIASAMRNCGLPTEISIDAGEYLCNFAFYRLLHSQAAPAIGFLHVPQVREYSDSAIFDLCDVALAVKAAASAIASHMAFPPP